MSSIHWQSSPIILPTSATSFPSPCNHTEHSPPTDALLKELRFPLLLNSINNQSPTKICTTFVITNYAMEVLNAAVLTPISIHKPTTPSTERKTEPKKLFPPFKCPRVFTKSLAAISCALTTNGLARALTYEEALNQSVSSPTSSFDFDIGLFLDGVLKFGSDNPLVLAGGAAALVVPLILSQVFKGESKPWGVESAKVAYAKLGEDAGAQLVDIRDARELRAVGGPDLKGLKKKAVVIVYKKEDKPGFLKKLALRFKDPANTTLFILDKFDGNSELVAELVAVNGFKGAYAIKDGAEGPRGWLSSGLPWLAPKKALTFDFEDLKDSIITALGGDSDGLSVTLGLAAATGLGLLAFTEIETVLQLLGSAALVQIVTKKLLFAEDRTVTLQQADEFLNTKIAPKELPDELKMIGKALLPAPIRLKSLPAQVEANPGTSTSATPVLNTESAPETKPEIEEEASPQPPLTVNSTPSAEVSEESVPKQSRPLSPYPYYPDFKPPSSPSPSQA